MQDIKLAKKDLSIWEVVRMHPAGIGPTDIGLKLGKKYTVASSYCSASLKKLLKSGKIRRVVLGGVKYYPNAR